MLIGRSQAVLGGSRVRTSIALGTQFRAHLVEREGLIVDSRFVAPSATRRDVVTLYFLCEGSLVTARGARFEAPTCVALAESEFECVEPRSETFRVLGSPSVTVDLCLSRLRFRAPVGLSMGPVSLPAAVWTALAALRGAESDASMAQAVSALLSILRAAELVDLDPHLELEEEEHLRRVWGIVRLFYERQDTGAYQAAFSNLGGISVRQVQRDLAELCRRSGLDGGFRATLKRMRLRRATLLLSARSVSVREVARAVGYGSVEAMARAFRDAGLPRPSEVMEFVGGGHAAPGRSG